MKKKQILAACRLANDKLYAAEKKLADCSRQMADMQNNNVALATEAARLRRSIELMEEDAIRMAKAFAEIYDVAAFWTPEDALTPPPAVTMTVPVQQVDVIRK